MDLHLSNCRPKSRKSKNEFYIEIIDIEKVEETPCHERRFSFSKSKAEDKDIFSGRRSSRALTRVIKSSSKLQEDDVEESFESKKY